MAGLTSVGPSTPEILFLGLSKVSYEPISLCTRVNLICYLLCFNPCKIITHIIYKNIAESEWRTKFNNPSDLSKRRLSVHVSNHAPLITLLPPPLPPSSSSPSLHSPLPWPPLPPFPSSSPFLPLPSSPPFPLPHSSSGPSYLPLPSSYPSSCTPLSLDLLLPPFPLLLTPLPPSLSYSLLFPLPSPTHSSSPFPLLLTPLPPSLSYSLLFPLPSPTHSSSPFPLLLTPLPPSLSSPPPPPFPPPLPSLSSPPPPLPLLLFLQLVKYRAYHLLQNTKNSSVVDLEGVHLMHGHF